MKGDKKICDFNCHKDIDTRQAGLRISETSDLMGWIFTYKLNPKVYTEHHVIFFQSSSA